MKKTTVTKFLRKFFPYILVITAFFICQSMIAAGTMPRTTKSLLIPVCVYIVMAVSLNLTVGISGELSLGHAGFMSIGAFTGIVIAAYTRQAFGVPETVQLLLAIIAGGIMAGIMGVLIGIPVLRLQGDYLAIVTLAFGEIIRVCLINLKSITGGPNGKQFSTIFTTSLDHGPMISYFAIVGSLILIVVLLQNFLRSTYGRAILAVREDEVAANSNGVGVFRYKMTGFVIASFIGGIGGALYAPFIGFVKPDLASFNNSINHLIYVVLGGMGSVTGGITAAFVLTILQEVLRFLRDYRLLIYPVILIFVMLFRPQGLLGTKELSFIKFYNGVPGLIARLFKKNSKEEK